MKHCLSIALSLFLGTLAHANSVSFADLVLVDKSERKLFLIRDDKPFREFAISLGREPIGHKQREGDRRTPEGRYILDWRNPQSRFYKSLHVSYPSPVDRSRADSRGVSPGGMIMVHGEPNGTTPFEFELFLRGRDWTKGCIAVRNADMDEIWRAVRDGTPIEIRP